MNEEIIFRNRSHAGQKLAKLLKKFRAENVVVYALPRGGVIIARELAKKFGWPIDLVIVRKIGHPQNEEYAIGAISESGEAIFDELELQNIDENYLKQKSKEQQEEAKRRHKVYLTNRKSINPHGKVAIIVDDGLATGFSMLAAIRELKKMKPKKIIVAVPVSPRDTAEKITKEVDEFIAVEIPEIFAGAIGAYYNQFEQVSDSEVIKALKT